MRGLVFLMMFSRRCPLRRGHLHTGLWTLALALTLLGARSQLTIFPPGPTEVIAEAGKTVTLNISFTGATNPALEWRMGTLPVVTWTLGSSGGPDIAVEHQAVLSVAPTGSLTFLNVPLNYSNSYTAKITKSGTGSVTTVFVLKVYEILRNVTFSAEPAYASEGGGAFQLRYQTVSGQEEAWEWRLNGTRISSGTRFTITQGNLVINQPERGDTGQYTLLLSNPLSRITAEKDIYVLYGPDPPVLSASPDQPFYQPGDALVLSCHSEGFPPPVLQWFLGQQNLNQAEGGVLNLGPVQTNHNGSYSCRASNPTSGLQAQGDIGVQVYERPSGKPECSVHPAHGQSDLQYRCQWLGGAPEAQLAFPELAKDSSAMGELIITVPPSQALNGTMILCTAQHPVHSDTCNITASSPAGFIPRVTTLVASDGKIQVTINCFSQAMPPALVSWMKGAESISNGTDYWVSNDTSQLTIQDRQDLDSILQHNYTCHCSNPLGQNSKSTVLIGPAISASSLFPNQDGTVVTLTWEVPENSVVTGFEIQMKGPDLLSGSPTKGSSDKFRPIKSEPGSVRHTDVSVLDPESTYQFQIIPVAGTRRGEATEDHRIGPGGLSGSAIAGIAAGIPCSFLVLLLVLGLLFYLVPRCRKSNRQARYPVTRAPEKAVGVQPDPAPRHKMQAQHKDPPDYNRLQPASSEKSMALPTFSPPPPVRTATTV